MPAFDKQVYAVASSWVDDIAAERPRPMFPLEYKALVERIARRLQDVLEQECDEIRQEWVSREESFNG